jgi:myo-inositol-1(or 4)-monophosphatase
MRIPEDRTAGIDPSDDLDRALAVAIRAARIAGKIQLDRLDRVDWVRHKSARDVVTAVDHECEERIITEIRREFPDDAILAEESGAQGIDLGGDDRPPATDAEEAEVVGPAPIVGRPPRRTATAGWGDRRVWIIDPLDGTVNYANGIPLYCVSIALARGSVPFVGVVLDPVRDELYAAIRGRGATRDGDSIRNPGKDRLIDCVATLVMPLGERSGVEMAVRHGVRAVRRFGVSALSIAFLADGRFDAYVQRSGMSNWDVAAAGLIAEEGGVRVTSYDGGPWLDLSRPSGSIGLLAATPPRYEELLSVIRSPGAFDS